MIEAVNKILKYRYIFRKDIPSFRSVDQVVKASVADYNARPHYALHGLTPDEVYAGKTFDFTGYKNRLALARARRLSENRRTKHPCEPFGDETDTEIV